MSGIQPSATISTATTNTVSNDRQREVNNVTEECKELMSTLPKVEEGWISKNLYQYQGFWHFQASLQGTLTCQNHFIAHDTDIILATTPKSGTTWLKALMYALVNRSRISPNLVEGHPLLKSNPHDLVPYLEIKLYRYGRIPDLSSMSPPRLLSTHLPLTSLPRSITGSDCKIVYLCRETKDAFISFWHFLNKCMPEISPQCTGDRTLEEAFDAFCKGVYWYGPFWDHVLGYWKESLEKPKKVMFLTFEAMKDQPALHVKRLAEFLGCPFSWEDEEDRKTVERILELCSFDNLSKLEVNKSGKLAYGGENKSLFRKGEIGDWMNYLTPEMAERIDRITEEKLHGSGLKL